MNFLSKKTLFKDVSTQNQSKHTIKFWNNIQHKTKHIKINFKFKTNSLMWKQKNQWSPKHN